MPQRTRPDAGPAARAAAVRSTGPQRRHPADDLERARDDLEAVIRERRAGCKSIQQFDRLEEEAQRIAAAIVANFRSPTR